VLDAGARAPRRPGAARIATWNLRWFPDGRPGNGASGEPGTDLAWLACALAWLDVDVVAVQEIKAHARARERTQELLASLDARTAGSWRSRIDDCPNAAGQHVGLLWNEKRVTASVWTTLASLNPHGEGCKDQLRPGLAARFRFGSGLDVIIVSLHLKSGRERRSYELRRRSLAGLNSALRELEAAGGDERDVLLAGDLNTMGCPDCSPPISGADEIATLETEVRSVGLRVVRPTPGCSEYFDGRAALLDHFVAGTRMAELPAQATSFVSGVCSETSCGGLSRRATPAAYTALSDHCPVVVDLDGRDLD
jgi:endonuclease/exonuclease/phosphatase family metal-dependent hydrolase